MIQARFLRVRGVVQGVGFRPFVFRLALRHGLTGWVLNGGEGVQIHVEGAAEALERFAAELAAHPPPAARISDLEVAPAAPLGCESFDIRASSGREPPTARISPDLPVCAACLRELFSPADRRHGYPYVNCTDCGPRFSIVLGLPYDRPRTTMRQWPMCPDCAREYGDPLDRRFHAQPVACPRCGPHFRLLAGGAGAAGAAGAPPAPAGAVEPGAPAGAEQAGAPVDAAAIRAAAALLAAGRIVAVKGLGGYHLACDAGQAAAVAALRERKYRKEKPFAVMAKDLAAARGLVELSPAAADLLTSAQRPIVLAPARVALAGVAPGNHDLGVMLPYTPVHHLLFALGAPPVLVMTSGNRSSEPIAYGDGEASGRLAGIADAFLAGERPIARRVDDSVARAGVFGPAVLRRARGYAPSAVARLPAARPVLALGADLKSAVTLVVGGEAFVSQHIGDLDHYDAWRAFREVIDDFAAMYELDWSETCVVHDLHPEYRSSAHAAALPAGRRLAVQHHRAHVASVLAEREALSRRVVGIALDGTGFGDDGSLWGGEIFTGSVAAGFTRAGHLRPAPLPGGDAAARHPVQAAAGFLAELPGLPDLTAPPFGFPPRYLRARKLLEKGLRTFTTTSAGRLFDTAAALLGFTREITFEGQAAIWLEQLAGSAGRGEPQAGAAGRAQQQAGAAVRAEQQAGAALSAGAARASRDPGERAPESPAYPLPFAGGQLDHRPLLAAMVEERLAGRPPAEIARAFHRAVAQGVADAVAALCRQEGLAIAVLSGGVFQNELLCADLAEILLPAGIELWTQRQVPCNDGGLSLGQAALALPGLA
jgi:hydrogenase maturation protein HypF